MTPVMWPEIVAFSCLTWVPSMIRKFILCPELTVSRIGQAKGHVIGAANMAKKIHIFVGATNCNQILAGSTHTGTIVTAVDWINGIHNSGGLPADVVNAPRPRYFFKARIVERIK